MDNSTINSSHSHNTGSLEKEHDPVELNEQEPEAFTGNFNRSADLESGRKSDAGSASELYSASDRMPEGGEQLSRFESNATASRTLSRRMTGHDQLIDEAKKSTEPLPPMGGGRDYPPLLPDREPYVVSFDGPDDPLHPYNLPFKKKLLYCATVGISALSASMGSAMFAAAGPVMEEMFHVGPTVTALGTSLFVFGFASGPVLWGPLTEVFGRKPLMILSMFLYTCLCFGTATTEHYHTIMITRFFAGFSAGSAFVAAPGVMADLFDAGTRGLATAVFAMVLFGGPMLAPIISAFIVKNPNMGWRWTEYITGILGGFALLLCIFCLEETYHPIILVHKAEQLRRRTGNWGIVAPHEEVTLDFKEVVEKNLFRPMVMLFTEPIIFLITLYNAFIYGILYLCLTAIPLIFQVEYGFQPGNAELPYLAMFVGTCLGGLICVFFENRFKRVMEANGGVPIPEERLPPMMVGSFFFAAGLFWLCWAGAYADKVHWIVPTIGAAPIGIGLIAIFLPCINYIIDCYLFFAASALAANTFLRSAFGAAFPLFARQMFVNLGTQWAGTLLGCLALILIPVPFWFYKNGRALREKSKYGFVL